MLFLLVCVFITAAAAYSYYVFKGTGFFFHDIGSDTSELYIPVYESIARHIRSGDFSLWDLSYGLGTSMYSQNLFHPTMLLLYFLGAVSGPEKVSSYLIVIHFIHILLSGLAAYVYLSSFKNLSLKSRLLIAYIYSFNGFLLTWGQHYTFGIETAFFPLILAMIERSFEAYSGNEAEAGTAGNTVSPDVRKRSFRAVIGLVILSAVLAMSTYYYSYMIMLASAFYTIFRLLFMKQPVLTKLKLLISRGLYMVWGLLIGITYLLPSYMVLSQNSSRLASDTGMAKTFLANLCPYIGEYYKSFFRRMVSVAMQGNGSRIHDFYGYGNFYEAPTVFLTGLMIILALQFIFLFPKIVKTGRQAVVSILAMLFLAFVVFVQAGSVMFNGFTYIFSRHLFAVLPILALMMAITLDHILKNRRFSIPGGAAAALVIAVICLSSVNKLEYRLLKLNCLLILVSSLLMIAGLVIYTKPSLKKYARAVPLLLALLAAVQVTGDTRASVYARVDKDYAERRQEGLFGTDASAVTNYIQSSDPSLFRTERTYVAASWLMDAASSGYYGFSTYNSTLNKNVIRFINEMIPESKTMDSEFRPNYREIIGRSAFEDLLGIKYLITDGAAGPVSGYEPVFSSGSLTVLENPRVQFASFYTEAVSEDGWRALKEKYSPDEIVEKVLVLNTAEGLSSSAGDLSAISRPEASLVMNRPEKEAHLTCEADVPKDGYILFPMPHEKGWSVKLDGQKSEMLLADFGFIAMRVPAGFHTISLDYHVPYLLPCVIISLVSLAAFIAFCILHRKRENGI